MNIDGINNNNINAGNTYQSKQNKVADDSFEKHLKNAVDKGDDEQLKKVCKDFEGIFLNMMYKQMKATIQKSDLIPGDSGREIFESMLDDKLTEEASKGKSLGLSEMLYKQLSKQLKNTYKPSNPDY